MLQLMANVADVYEVITEAVRLGKNLTNNFEFCKNIKEGFTIKEIVYPFRTLFGYSG